MSWRDWFPHTGAVFVPAYVAVLFVATSIGLLTSSPRRTGLGIVCAAAACGLAGLLVQFFRRPVRDPFDATAAAAVIDGDRPLLVTAHGYDRGDVDRFLGNVAAHSVADIESVTFKTRWSGYDPQEVDAVLTLWAWRKRYPAREGHPARVAIYAADAAPTASRPQAD